MSGLDTLHEALQFANETDVKEDIDESFIDVLRDEISSVDTYTVSLFYTPETNNAHLVTNGKIPRTVVDNMEPESYLRICESLGVFENDNYNLSGSRLIGNIYARIFAITRPISQYPNITISTSKEPPSTWDQIEVSEMLNSIMDENFIIVGASGAGKTFLLNYMLKKKHAGTPSKIAMIEEFSELIIPNKGTFRLSVPTAKPNEPRLLEFITEQSNLMRMDYLYVGEIKGSEAFPFLNNLASGTTGAATVHGSSVRDGVDRFKNLCMMFGAPEKSVAHSISRTLKYVIYVRDHQIRHIAELSGVQQMGAFQMKDIYLHPSEEKTSRLTGGVMK